MEATPMLATRFDIYCDMAYNVASELPGPFGFKTDGLAGLTPVSANHAGSCGKLCFKAALVQPRGPF
jgi:hypothetical protein